MYKNLINESNSKSADSAKTAATTPKAAPRTTPKTPSKVGPGGRYVSVERHVKDLKTFAEVLDSELSERDQRLDGLEGRVSVLEGKFNASSAPAPAPEPEPEPVPEPKKSDDDVTFDTKQSPAGFTGPGRAYRFWDFETRTYGLTSKAYAAKQIDKDYAIVYVWYQDGCINHLLTKEEIKKYIP